MNYNLLKELCEIHAPSGSEEAVRDFILKYIEENSHSWQTKPQLFYGDGFQDGLVLVFGEPKTAIYAHMDSIGFTVRYNNGLVKIGGPVTETGYALIGEDSKGKIETKLEVNDDKSLKIEYPREIERGTTLTFKPYYREDSEYIENCYIDNRLGIFAALKVAETIKNGAIAFTCWEEHGKGGAAVLGRFLYKQFGVMQALIADISWITDGVEHAKGPVISIRDSGIPRRSYVNRVIKIAKDNHLLHQIEVEGSGGSDGNELQNTPYPIDWCFVGAPIDNVHTPNEKVHKTDIVNTIELYKALINEL